MNYPNRVIALGEKDTAIVRAIQTRLIALGDTALKMDGIFGQKTKSAVKLFQSLHRDKFGAPLVADGKVGALTWEALFGPNTVPQSDTPESTCLKEVIKVALSQVGVMEDPVGSNTGRMVNQYLASTGTPPGNYWCAAFVYWCFREASSHVGQTNPLVKTAGCLDHWNRTTGKKILAADALNKPSLIQSGSIFIVDHGGGRGHTGIVQKVEGGFLTTIEGNSNPDGSNNGIGVFHLSNRKINSVNKGFIFYTLP